MTTDPIERVADAIEVCVDSSDWKLPAEAAINEYKAWLAEQSIDVDKLLSGEMVAVPRNPDWSQGLNRSGKVTEP